MLEPDSDPIEAFLSGEPFAVAGASTNRDKYGNKVLRCYVQNGRRAFPVHPRESEIEGLTAYPSVADLPELVHGLSIITPPEITVQVVKEALAEGIRYIWMQPGAEHPDAIAEAESVGATVIHGGPCLLVALGYRE
jgi:predicted CoA-binding protein